MVLVDYIGIFEDIRQTEAVNRMTCANMTQWSNENRTKLDLQSTT
jgi:hypothetical protein